MPDAGCRMPRYNPPHFSPKEDPMRYRLSLLLLLIAPAVLAEPRAISGAEREAVRIAADYLSRGPAAIVENLAASSPLRKLSPTDQLAEIEACVGPNTGASWELQTVMPSQANSEAVFGIEFPSGVDDAAQFELKQENGAYKIHDIHVLAERTARTPYFPPEPEDTPKHEEPASSPLMPLVMATVLMALLAVTGALTIPRQKRIGRIVLAGAMLLGVLVVGRTVRSEEHTSELQQ